jgi:hypothetical protein
VQNRHERRVAKQEAALAARPLKRKLQRENAKIKSVLCCAVLRCAVAQK